MIKIESNCLQLADKFRRFGINTPIELSIAMTDIGRSLVRVARSYEPGGNSNKWKGSIAKNINFRKLNKYSLLFYAKGAGAVAQEYGYSGHLAPLVPRVRAWIKDHPGSEKAVINNKGLKVKRKPKKISGYFMGPAVQSVRRRLPIIIKRAIVKAQMKS